MSEYCKICLKEEEQGTAVTIYGLRLVEEGYFEQAPGVLHDIITGYKEEAESFFFFACDSCLAESTRQQKKYCFYAFSTCLAAITVTMLTGYWLASYEIDVTLLAFFLIACVLGAGLSFIGLLLEFVISKDLKVETRAKNAFKEKEKYTGRENQIHSYLTEKAYRAHKTKELKKRGR